ncbi:hypothetical protein ElyMa_002335800 [Elysia marginata]|uniref:Uncharacterized protein n=1 Tax=Elysia marginata TaxID=1093978 RepID=A0AAV4G697_9GAST|nr:hypothetical protein ElyMa_002335800 [Elysia marginata]
MKRRDIANQTRRFHKFLQATRRDDKIIKQVMVNAGGDLEGRGDACHQHGQPWARDAGRRQDLECCPRGPLVSGGFFHSSLPAPALVLIKIDSSASSLQSVACYYY